MGKPGSRKQKNSLIIESNKVSFRAFFIAVFTLIFWGYSLLVLLFFLSALVGFHNEYLDILKNKLGMPDSQLRHFIYWGAGIGLFFFILLWSWRIYNKNRFGSLRRRKYPHKTTDEDILALQLISKEDYMKLKNAKVIVFERNPIRAIKKQKDERKQS